jgi:hypothetical protein
MIISARKGWCWVIQLSAVIPESEDAGINPKQLQKRTDIRSINSLEVEDL